MRPAQGNLAGAARINAYFVSWLEKDYFPHENETLVDVARDLGYSAPEFLAKASAAFEKRKIEYPKEQHHNIVINKRLGAPRTYFNVSLDR